MRRTVIALLLFVSGAAAAVAQTAKQNPPAQGHCAVGVQSRLGDGFTVGNKKVSVESWHIDDLVVDRFRAAVGKRAVVQRIPYRKELVVTRPPLLWWRFVNSTETLRRMAAGRRCARYVVVTAGVEDSDLVGLGIVNYRDLFFPPQAFVYAVITMWVYDGDTFAFLRGASSPSGRHRKVDQSFWPDSPESAAQNPKLREATRELVTQELDAMLQKLPLTR